MIRRFFSLLILLAIVSGCNGNKDEIIRNYSQDLELLSKYIDLSSVDASNSVWVTGEVMRESTDDSSLLPSDNDWWLVAVINLKPKFDLDKTIRKCDFRYQGTIPHVDEVSLELMTDSELFLSKKPINLYQPCLFRSSPLVHGFVAFDEENNQILINMYTL